MVRNTALPEHDSLSQNEVFLQVNIDLFDDMCRMGRWLFWSWFGVKRSIFSRRCARNHYYIFVFTDLHS